MTARRGTVTRGTAHASPIDPGRTFLSFSESRMCRSVTLSDPNYLGTPLAVSRVWTRISVQMDDPGAGSHELEHL
jgi:hypothetical protein